jgi:uncharacterized protein (DUF433 family)
MILDTTAQPVPLETDSDGVVRVAKTRVTLETVVDAFMDGATAEEISFQYPSLDLADVYNVIGYYLRRTSEVHEYLQRRRAHVERLKLQNETRFDPVGIRDRLLTRSHRS